MSTSIRRTVVVLQVLALALSGCAHTVGVYSYPSGAEVLIDSKPTGQTTPAYVPIRDLAYGSHLIWVRKDGYQTRGTPREIEVAFRSGLVVSSVLFFYTPFPWIKAIQTGYKGLTYPISRLVPEFWMDRIEAPKHGPVDFDDAVRRVVNEVFTQVNNDRIADQKTGAASFVSDAVIDANTGEVTDASVRIEHMVEGEARRNFPLFNISDMDSGNIDKADYVVNGIIPLETYPGEERKLYHLSLSVLDRKSGQIVAHSDAWIANPDLAFLPTPLYRDSPMYMKDARVEALIATAKATAGSLANKEYFNSLGTSALLGEAGRAYDQGDYRLALGLFAKAAERADGKVMKTFSGLYQSFFKLKQPDQAEQAFASLAELGMRNGNLGVKFLFNVDATEFFGGQAELEQYQIWLRQIASAVAASENCVRIVGHASHSGTKEHNQQLSLKRAELVQAKLQAEVPGVSKKTRAIGRGFDENIIGTGSNDASDAIDRRVEFSLALCGL